MGFLTTFLYSQFFVTPKYPDYDFSGQTVIVTGSNGGLGFEAAQHIVRLNAAKVIIACRTLSKGEEAKEKILSSTKRKDDCIEVWKLNLSATESVKEFAKQAEALDRLDAVIENAGVSNEDWRFDGDVEQTIQVNVISTILLALLLLPKLRETAQRYATTAHLEVVTSEMHQITKFEAGKTGNVYERLAEQANKGNGQSER
jgi:retinol dehydrogenase 12